METARERELQLQGRQAWPWPWPWPVLHTTATSMDASSSSSGGGGDRVLLGWEWDPSLGCFGVLAAAAGDAGVHDLFPLCTDAPPVSPATSTAAALPPAAAMPEELDDLLLNFWDASSYGDVFAEQQQQQVALNSSCVLQSEKTSTAAAAITTNSFLYDDPLGSIFSAGPTLAEKAVVVEMEPLLSSSSSSNCHADPRIGHVSGAPTPGGGAPAPPPPRSSSSSLKRPAPEAEETEAECSQSSGKRRKGAAPAAAGVVCPFAVLKPDGLDGGATLADINARILMRPARPVRHPVGEFACAPRVSADKPGISGKTVSGFTRLHTPGRGTITIIRTRG